MNKMSKMEEKKLYECKCCEYTTPKRGNLVRHNESKHKTVENTVSIELYKALEEENKCLKAEIESSKQYYKLQLLEKENEILMNILKLNINK